MQDRILITMLNIILLVIAIVIFSKVTIIGIKKADYNNCQKLKMQSEQHRLFYLTIDEKRVCNEVGVNINAPVK